MKNVLAQLLYVLYSMIVFYEISPLDKAHTVMQEKRWSVLMDVEDNNNVTSYFQVQNLHKDTV